MQNTLFRPEIWLQRWQALQTTIQQTMRSITTRNESLERKETLLSLLTCLQVFGESQVDFFVEGFGSGAKVRLEPSNEYPADYALRATINQIAYDLDVIQRAYHQRLPALASLEMQKTLNRADILAYQALEPAIRQGLLENTTVITYFQKAVNVRILPYAPVALIGIPLSAINASRDLLALPHEVGHYVFRHGRVREGQYKGSRFDAALEKELSGQPSWSRAWLEEIFADVYGAMIGGPAMALSFQEMAAERSTHDLMEDDGEHPVDAIRPDVYHTILRKIGGTARTVALLEARWEQMRKQLGNPTSFVPANADCIVGFSEAYGYINEAIEAILAMGLTGLQPVKGCWSAEPGEGQGVDQLYQQFKQVVAGLPTDPTGYAPDLTTSKLFDNKARISLEPLSGQTGIKLVEYNAGATGQWIDAIKNAIANGAQFNMPPQVWMEFLDCSGWAIEGPLGGNTHTRIRA